LAFDRGGSLLAASWNDGRVSLFDGGSGALKREVQTGVRKNMHLPVALSPGGDLLATIGPDFAVQLYALAGTKEPVSLGRHRGAVRSLCFSPSENLLVSASEDHTVKVWDVRGQDEPLTLLGHTGRVNCVAFGPDGELVASAGDDHTVRIWDARHGQPVMVLNPEIGAVLAVAFGPDSCRLAVSGVAANSETPGAERPVCLYQLTSRQQRRRLAGHTYQVHGLAFHPAKPLLASGSGDKTVIVWDVPTGQPRRQWAARERQPVVRMAYAPDGNLLAVGIGKFFNLVGTDCAVDLWDVEAGAVKRRLVGPNSTVDALAFAPAGQYLAAGTANGTVFIWNPATDAAVGRWQGRRAIVGVTFIDRGARLATADAGGRVTLRDVSGDAPAREATIPSDLTCIAVAPGEHVLAAGGADGALRLLTLPTLEPRPSLEHVHDGAMTAVAFSPDGKLLATGGADSRVVLWDARTRGCASSRKRAMSITSPSTRTARTWPSAPTKS
jgi:WD40 repeat protein